MYGYYDRYKCAVDNGDKEGQARWARQLTWEVARHAAGEEIVVYPLLEQHLREEGKRIADNDRADHQASFTFSLRFPRLTSRTQK